MIPLLSLTLSAVVPLRLLPLVPHGSALQVAAAQPAAPASTPAPSQAPSGRVVRLDDAVQIALRSQPTVHEARAQTEAASGQADQARAPMLPQLNAQAGYQRQHGGASAFSANVSPTFSTPTVSATGTPQYSTPADHDLFTFGANASILVYDFNQSPDKLRAANRNVDSFRASEHTAELGVLLNVRRAFFAARAYKALVGVAQETLQNEDRHMAQIRGYVAAGTHPEIDLVQERTTLANDKVALINAQNNYEIGKAQLNQAMGVVGDTNYDVAEEGLPAVPGEEGADERLVDTALKARPEIVALQKQKEADELTVRALKGGYGPSLTAGAAGGTAGYSMDALTAAWAVGATINWPFFQGGLTRGQVRTAEANLSYVQAQLDAETLQVRFDVQQAALTLRAAKASIDAANEALANAREQLRLAEGRYQAGVGSIIELGDAQITATNAAAQVVQADFNLSTARAQLLSALGRP